MMHHEFSHFLNDIGSLSAEQLRILRRAVEQKLADSDEAVQTRLLKAGLLSEIKPVMRTDTGSDDFTAITLEGEPVSDTILHERR